MRDASRVPSWVVHGFAAAAMVMVGCSVSDFTEKMFSDGSDPSGPGGTGGGTGSSTTTTSSTSSAETSSSSGGGAGQGGAGTTTTTTTTGVGGGGAGGSGTTNSIDCGYGLTCPQEPNSACCWYAFQEDGECIQGPPSPQTCNTSTQNDGYHTRIECQLPEHCPGGQVCCGNREPTGQGSNYYTEITCEAFCALPDIVMCDPTNPDCPIGTACKPSGSLPEGFSVCSPP